LLDSDQFHSRNVGKHKGFVFPLLLSLK
jgi:hypothetical protein